MLACPIHGATFNGLSYLKVTIDFRLKVHFGCTNTYGLYADLVQG